MATEKTRAKFINQFAGLIKQLESYGLKYNPTNVLILIAALKLWLIDAKAALKALNVAAGPWVIAVNKRHMLFVPFNKLISRIVEAVIACGASSDFIKDVESLARELIGKRAKPIPVIPEGEAPPDEVIKTISAAQLSYDSRINNFDALIQLLLLEPKYTPNEADLTTAALTTVYNNLDTKNDAVIAAFPDLSNARVTLNDILYFNPTKSGSELSGVCKKYIQSVFGGNSPQYHQVAAFKFPKPKA